MAAAMNPYKTLFDLSHCLVQNQESIPHDSCQIFSTLAQHQDIQLHGLLYAAEGNLFNRLKKPNNRAEAVEQASYFFQNAFDHDKFYLTKLMTKLKLKRFFSRTKKQYDLYPIDKVFDEVIWRNLLSHHLSSAWQQSTLACSYYFSDMTQETLSAINTEPYDFVIFPDVSPVRVTGKTIKIVRFRDLVEQVQTDILSGEFSGQFARALKQASGDAYFVCDNDISRHKLIECFPHLEERSSVIASAACVERVRMQDRSKLDHIIATRISGLRGNQTERIRKMLDTINSFEYILNVGTLNPEKNLSMLVSAWERLNHQHKRGLKLVIVADNYVLPREIESFILPHIEQGNIIYLTKVSDIELSFLYSHAKLFVTPAFSNTNSSHLFSAMNYACPTLVSDIPVHRWVMADAAWYCDPHSESGLADALSKLLYTENAETLRESLISKGLQRIKMFSHEKLAKQWIDLFEKLKVVKAG
jgi:glycosyltransferase involved in cell wall biosynthesis